MTVPTPRSTALSNGARWTASSCCRVTCVMPWSIVYEPVVERAVRRAAVADEVLGGGEDLVVARRGPCRRRCPAGPVITVSIDCDERRVLAERLVRAAPAVVAGHAQAGREVPRDAGGADLGRGHRAGLLGERPDRGWRRCRCCAAGSSRRRRCCGRAPRRRRRSAGSGTGSPAPAAGSRRSSSAQAAGVFGRRRRAAAGEQRAEVVRGDVAARAGARCARPGSSGRPSPPGDIRASRSATRFFTGSFGVEVRQAVRVDHDLRGLGGRLGAGDRELQRDRLGGLGGTCPSGWRRRRSARCRRRCPPGR